MVIGQIAPLCNTRTKFQSNYKTWPISMKRKMLQKVKVVTSEDQRQAKHRNAKHDD